MCGGGGTIFPLNSEGNVPNHLVWGGHYFFPCIKGTLVCVCVCVGGGGGGGGGYTVFPLY